MKKLLTLALTAILLLGCAQTGHAEFRWGPTLGMTYNHPRFKQILFPTQDKMGFAAGVTGENIFPGIGIGMTLGLEYQMRTHGLDLGDREIWASQGLGHVDLRMSYIALPIHLRWKWTRLNGLEEKIAPFIYGGPTIGFMVGHSKLKPFTFAHGDVNLDCGFGLELFRRLQISGGYSFGMTYAYKAKILTNFSARTNFWTVRVAYFFKD